MYGFINWIASSLSVAVALFIGCACLLVSFGVIEPWSWDKNLFQSIKDWYFAGGALLWFGTATAQTRLLFKG